MDLIADETRDSVMRSRNYAQAFLALSQLHEPASADPDKYAELMETGKYLLDLAGAALDDARQNSLSKRGNGSDV